jgi:hypothetical protein
MVLKYDYTVTIVVTKRTDDYHACIKGHPEIWGCGRDKDEAVGDLIRSHESEFGIKVKYGRSEHKYGVYVLKCCNCGFMKYAGISPVLDMMRSDIGTSEEVINHFDENSKCCKKPMYLIEE